MKISLLGYSFNLVPQTLNKNKISSSKLKIPIILICLMELEPKIVHIFSFMYLNVK